VSGPRARPRESEIVVRRVGATRRLYVGGVLASQWNPGRTLAGGYWDALATAPFLSEAPCETALVLGLGGGAVVHVLRGTVRPRRVVGVEADARVLRAARAEFPLEGEDLVVEVGDAVARARRPGERFDLVVDDLYEMASSRADRPAAEGEAWFRALARRTSPGGVLAVNFVDEAAYERARPALARALRSFRTVARFDFDGWTNVVVGATRAPGGIERYEAAFCGAVPDREARARGFRSTPVRIRSGGPRPGAGTASAGGAGRAKGR
jgi:hypothetical protein